MRIYALFLVCLVLAACGPSLADPALEQISPMPSPVRLPPPPIVTPAKAGETATEVALREARDLTTHLRGDLALSLAREQSLQVRDEREHAEADVSTIRMSCMWVIGIAFLGGIACAVLAIVSPIAKGTLAKFGIACGAALLLASGCAWAAPYLPIVGAVALLVVALGAALAGVVALVRWWPSFAHAAIAAADGLQQATRAVRATAPGIAEAMDIDNRALQLQAGGRAFLEGDRLHAAARAKRAKQAKAQPGEGVLLG